MKTAPESREWQRNLNVVLIALAFALIHVAPNYVAPGMVLN